MEEKVIEILREILENNTIDITCSQKNCEKWDSMAQLNIAAELEMAFDVSFEPEEMAEMVSAEEIIKILKSK